MKFLDIDGPIMRFLGNAFDFFVIFLLTVICSLPILTAGPALTAGSYVSMKIHRKEAPKVFSSFFRAFRDNFKMSFLMGLMQLVFVAFILFDFSWVYQVGWSEVPMLYKILIILSTCVVVFFNLTVYPVIARFDMTFGSTLKTSLILMLTTFPFLFIVVLIVGVTVFLCIWFFNWLPLFFVIGFTGACALHGWIMKNACEKLIKKVEEFSQPAQEGDVQESEESGSGQ